MEVGRDLESLWVLWMGGVGRAHSWMEALLWSRSVAGLYRALAAQTGVQVLGSHWVKLSGTVARNLRESFGGVMTLENTERQRCCWGPESVPPLLHLVCLPSSRPPPTHR